MSNASPEPAPAKSTTNSDTTTATNTGNNIEDSRAALHDALDALIVIISDEQAFGASNVDDAQALAHYAAKLKTLANCAAQTGAAALASACDVFAQVVISRAAHGTGVTEEERGLLNLFPMLTMDSIADPDNHSADSALFALANDPLWDSIHAATNAVAQASQNQMPSDANVASDGFAAQENDNSVSSEKTSNTAPTSSMQQISPQMLALLARECGMLGGTLEQDLQAVYVASADGALSIKPEALINYLESLTRIGETAASVGLTALHALFVQLTQNLSTMQQESAEEQAPLLAQLPAFLQGYLNNPCEPNSALPLMTLLCEPALGGGEIDFDAWFAALCSLEYIADEVSCEERQSVASEADVNLSLPDDLNPELLEGLLQELPVQVASFTSAIGRFSAGLGEMSDLEQAKRAAHTLKGAANTVGVAGIANLTHHLEDILITCSDQQTLPSRQLATLLTEAGDCLEAMSEAVMGIGPVPEQALAVLQMVLDYVNLDQGLDDASDQAMDAAASASVSQVQQTSDAANWDLQDSPKHCAKHQRTERRSASISQKAN